MIASEQTIAVRNPMDAETRLRMDGNAAPSPAEVSAIPAIAGNRYGPTGMAAKPVA